MRGLARARLPLIKTGPPWYCFSLVWAKGTFRNMASIKKSFEGLKSTTQSASKGVTDSAVQAAQDAVHQVAESSKETTTSAAEEATRQTHAVIGSAAGKASDTIKEFGQKMGPK